MSTLFIYLFIYLFVLFLAALGLRFCARAFSSCGEQGPLFIAVRGPLTVAAALVAEHRLQTSRLSSCGTRALLLHGMWDLPRPGLKPVSPALAGRLSTTAPPGKPQSSTLILCFFSSTLFLYSVVLIEQFTWFHFLSSLNKSIIIFLLVSGFTIVFSINSQLIQVHFQITLYCFMVSAGIL